ncbi:MAG: glycoside hydrolase, partial [Anaerolineae bacterium]|nr:glycoside hydrolase [Anaerolineae bacterium]
MRKLLVLLTLLSFVLPAAQARQDEPVLYVALIWHQHQPVYFKDPDTNVYIRPWVRVHATKDYLDMAAMLQNYPDIKATFNITPSLIRQLDDLSSGTKDLYQVMAEIPADQLSDSDKQFIAERFFDTNQHIVARFPRYQELANQRAEMGVEGVVAAWSADDFRDLQLLFNLAWTDPDWLAQEPLLSLVQKERGYSEADKTVLFAEHLRIVQEVIPFHAEMQQSGQIEVTMTPFAHPILPLLVDSSVAAVAMPDEALPERFTYGQDAVAQVELGVQLYESHFGVRPRGMWPAEGSVSPSVVQMIANQDIQWIATDEEILARSLEGFEGFTRNSQDTVQQADVMYQPYLATGGRGGQVAMFFRDHLISDKVGFEYSGMSGQEAADDLLQRLENIRQRLIEEGAEGPHVVTVLLDGENAWEYYENDGKEFLNGMYQGLSESETLVTVTPSEYLAMTGTPQELDELWPGSWINPTFNTWIGEEEENLAWTYLLQMRQDVQEASATLDEATLAQVMELVYIAEGSDWFWWYGADQNSGLDSSFDEQFRLYLEQIYLLMGQEVPNFVSVPIIPQAAQEPTQPFIANFTPTIDGAAAEDEWKDAGYYDLGDGSGLYFGFDDTNLYLRTEGVTGDTVSFYLRGPDSGDANAYP